MHFQKKEKKNYCACEATFTSALCRVAWQYPFQMPPWTLACFDVIMTYHQGDSLFGTRCIQWNLAIVMSSAAHFSVKYGHTNWNRWFKAARRRRSSGGRRRSSSWEYWLVNYGIEAGNQLWLCLCVSVTVTVAVRVSLSLTLTMSLTHDWHWQWQSSLWQSSVWLNLTHHSDSRDWVETVSVWIEIAFGFDAIFHGSRLIRHDIASFHYALFCVVRSRI